jgi:hypothetical protein
VAYQRRLVELVAAKDAALRDTALGAPAPHDTALGHPAPHDTALGDPARDTAPPDHPGSDPDLSASP